MADQLIDEERFRFTNAGLVWTTRELKLELAQLEAEDTSSPRVTELREQLAGYKAQVIEGLRELEDIYRKSPKFCDEHFMKFLNEWRLLVDEFESEARPS